ncbi:MAG: efflux RND transporter periplasmic adaptor subunit [Planctomycetes bacterium]|nr:efflux RND transporter periplasmic adaptor subunit [Planctomycetota bacterium]
MNNTASNLFNTLPVAHSRPKARTWALRAVTVALLLVGFVGLAIQHRGGSQIENAGMQRLHSSDSLSSDRESLNSPSPLVPNYKPLEANGTEVLVRAYRIEDAHSQQASRNTFTGTLQSRYQSSLGFRVNGKIIERLVETGDRVRQGQVLMRLDPEDWELYLKVAESDLAASRSQLNQIEKEEARLRDLRTTGSASQSDHDLAIAALDTAREKMESATKRLQIAKNQRNYCDLVADHDGLITKVVTEIGQVVTAGQPVLQWAHGDELEAVVSIPESLHQEIKNHDVEISFWSRPNDRIQGKLRELSPIADPLSRTYDARFQLVDPPADLAIGLTATVHLLQSHNEGIRIPMGSIANGNTKPIVWRILDDNTVDSVPVEVLRYESDGAVVRGELRTGDKIISAGVQKIDATCRIRIWNNGT